MWGSKSVTKLVAKLEVKVLYYIQPPPRCHLWSISCCDLPGVKVRRIFSTRQNGAGRGLFLIRLIRSCGSLLSRYLQKTAFPDKTMKKDICLRIDHFLTSFLSDPFLMFLILHNSYSTAHFCWRGDQNCNAFDRGMQKVELIVPSNRIYVVYLIFELFVVNIPEINWLDRFAEYCNSFQWRGIHNTFLWLKVIDELWQKQ